MLSTVAGLLLGLRVAGPVERPTSLGVVSLRAEPARHGEVEAFIPLANWGVRARAFDAPLQLHVEPRTLNRQAVIRAAAGDRGVLRGAQRDAERAARHALIRAALWALGGALLAAALGAALLAGLRGARRSAALWAGAHVLLAVAVAGLVVWRIYASFDANAFRAPQFFARGAELEQLLDVADTVEKEGDAYSSQVDRTLSGYATLLSSGGRFGAPEGGSRAVLISDLHANTLVLDAVNRLANGGLVFFAGDFGQAGTEAEADLLVPRVTRLGRVVAVSGNHDSRGFMRRLAAAGAIVLTEDGRLNGRGGTDGRPVVEVDGMTVAGFADPLESRVGDPNDPKRIFSFAERPNGEAETTAAKARILTWFRSLQPRPQIVLLHQNGLAQALAQALQAEAGPELLILTGHDHRQHVDRHGTTLVVDGGSVGAGGLLGAGKQPVGVAQLELSATSAWPATVDLIQQDPLSGSASADRLVPTAEGLCDHERVTCEGG